ncbi:hypothetical protein [Streptomyces sp. NRRL S-1813]|uniref:hypothetical protein n=1 Tax=Streptomyces sp. NRRL S-1813 TaxID=1463888 RepID=UPI000691299C|nr:hypothetical protein [Streptomyces sp. NRRL S-1813]
MSWLNVKHAMHLAPWIRVPLMWPEPGLEDVEEAQSPEAWARYFAEGLWEDFASEKPKPGEVDLLTNILLMYALRAPAAFPDFEVFLHLPHPREIPLPAYVDLVEIEEGEDRETALHALTHADASYAIEPPIVDDFDSPHLGTGLRVLRYYQDQDEDSNEVHVGLRYAWRFEKGTEAADVLIILADPDAGRILRSLDDIDAFARTIRISPNEEADTWKSS